MNTNFNNSKTKTSEGGVIMRIDSIKNQTYPIYDLISFKGASASDTASPVNGTQTLQDSFERTDKTAANTPGTVVTFLGKVHNAIQSFINATPDPYYSDYLIGLPY